MEPLRDSDPRRVGPWNLLKRIGSGGMATVFLGTSAGRTAAVKVVHPFILENPANRARLRREVANLQRIESAFVAKVIDADINADPAWLAVAYVDGPSLDNFVDLHGPVIGAAWLELAHGVLSALAAVHEAGIVHRDIKPKNLLMSDAGPVLIDFGISYSADATSLTTTGAMAGTPLWFAPEQFTGGNVHAAADIFSTGALLYFAATANSPWGDAKTIPEIMHNILETDPDLTALSDSQRALLGGMLQKEPRRRPSIDLLFSQLHHVRSSTTSNVPTNTGPRRRRTAALAAIGVSIIVALIGLLALKPASQDRHAGAPRQEWLVRVEGEAAPHKGTGANYEFFICDQAVDRNSLVLRAVSATEATPLPLVSLLRDDARCGVGFDTLLVTGSNTNPDGLRRFVLTGSTADGFMFQYPFEVENHQFTLETF